MKNLNTEIKRGIYVRVNGGVEIARRDLIKKLYLEGSEEFNITPGSRRQIMNFINSEHITPKQNIPFQIVFQATAGCTLPTMDHNQTVIDQVRSKAVGSVQAVLEDAAEAKKVLEKVTGKVKN